MMNATMKTDETMRQERSGSCQRFTEAITGHGTIPLLLEGVPEGRGSGIDRLAEGHPCELRIQN